METVKSTGDRILVRLIKDDGICHGEVVSTGKNCLKVGLYDKVMFNKRMGVEIDLGIEKCFILHEDDVRLC